MKAMVLGKQGRRAWLATALVFQFHSHISSWVSVAYSTRYRRVGGFSSNGAFTCVLLPRLFETHLFVLSFCQCEPRTSDCL
ncbi:hypothetical protein M433DRAFT_379806 [Acidomyces richmondensis BFW]|nr:MAG: hypothetical protein FE78DRAFT_321029 [Acidomyces sp. 'richmondensis']KYG48814.1 hypothetical protein M433DRAFT_379806 [Acidomyces richmondensis BFW]